MISQYRQKYVTPFFHVNYFLYGTVAALVFNQIFFVSENPTIGLMLAYASFVMIASIVTSILIPMMGTLSDKVGRKPLYVWGSIAMMLYAFPYFWLIHQGSVVLLFIATIIGLGVIWAPITAVLGTIFSEIFSAEIRYTGVSLGYQIGAALAGGTAPLVAVVLLAAFDNSYVPVAIYIMLTAAISLVAMSRVTDKYKAVLEAKIANQIENPLRTVIEFPKEHASVLYMPSADLNANIMTMEAVTIFPNNPAKGKKTTQGVVLVSDATNGDHLALLNASYLTRLRTGALSGLATDQLAKKNATVLTVIGTGAMAFEQVLGVLAVRDIQTINLFNPSRDSAVAFKNKLRDFGIPESIAIHIIEDRVQAVKDADIINCATRSKNPVFDGNDLQLGTHVNGVGSYLPDMQEVDFTFIQRAHKIIVDDFHGATEEAGELIHANQQDDWSYDEIKGELAALVVNHIL